MAPLSCSTSCRPGAGTSRTSPGTTVTCGSTWTRCSSHPRRLQPYVAELASQLTRHGLEVVCGPLAGGAFVAQAVAAELDVDFCYSAARVVRAAGRLRAGRRRPPRRDRGRRDQRRLGGGRDRRRRSARSAATRPWSAPAPPRPHTRRSASRWSTWPRCPAHSGPSTDCPLCHAGAPLDRPPS